MTCCGDTFLGRGLLAVVECDALRVCRSALKERARRSVSQCPIQQPIRLQPSNMVRFAGLRAVRDPATGSKVPVQIGVTPGEAVLRNRRLRWPLLHTVLRLLGGTIGESLMTQLGKGSTAKSRARGSGPSQLRQADGILNRERSSAIAMKR